MEKVGKERKQMKGGEDRNSSHIFITNTVYLYWGKLEEHLANYSHM